MHIFAENIIIFFEFFTCFFVVFRMKFRKKSVAGTVLILFCSTIILVSSLAGVKWGTLHIGIMSGALLFFYLVEGILFQVRLAEMALFGIAQWLLLSLFESTAHTILSEFYFEKSLGDNLVILAVTLGLWIYYFAIGRKNDGNVCSIPLKIWCLIDLVLLVITSMMSFFQFVIMEKLPKGPATIVGKGLFVFGQSFILFILFAIIYYYNRTGILRVQQEVIALQNEQQKEYFQTLLEKEEETRKFRHDIKNDLLVLQNFCMLKHYDGLEIYLNSMIGEMKKIGMKSFDVGNEGVNAVLNYYLQSLKEQYVVEVSGYMSPDILIEQRDLCVIVGNLVKNAAEAVVKCEFGTIRVSVSQGNQYLTILVENTFSGDLKTNKKGMILTSKKDKKNHGIGIRNIENTVEKYKGICHFSVEDKMFCAKVSLPV